MRDGSEVDVVEPFRNSSEKYTVTLSDLNKDKPEFMKKYKSGDSFSVKF